MSTNLTITAVAEIPAAYVAVPAPQAVFAKQGHRVRTTDAGMTDVLFGQDRQPQGIPL